MEPVMQKPESKLYFVRKTSARERPIVGEIKIKPEGSEAKPARKQRQPKKQRGMDAQARVDEAVKRRKVRNLQYEQALPDVGDVAKLKEKIKSKSIAEKLEKQRQLLIEKAKKEAQDAVERQKTEALLRLPAELERARVAIEELAPLQQQQIIALQNVAPDVVEGLIDEWEAKYPVGVPPIAPVPPAPAPAPAPAGAIAPAPVDVDALLPILGKYSARTTANLKRFWGNNKQSETNRNSIKSASSAQLQAQLDAKPALDADYLDAIRKIIADKEAKGQGLEFGKENASEEDVGGGFFSDLKDKLLDTIKNDPIGAAKKAFELGKAGREEYAKHFGKKIRAGKLKIDKKHRKVIHAHMKKIYGGGWADAFLSGLTLPFQLASKLPIPGVQQVGEAGTSIASALNLPSLI